MYVFPLYIVYYILSYAMSFATSCLELCTKHPFTFLPNPPLIHPFNQTGLNSGSTNDIITKNGKYKQTRYPL